ncbi:hypothetical protein B0H13DRAFT_1918553 [Mycena leptocephala]|nr:hypothetical protein B0H13DRAFT_1918553 [Mycena leptocephala]
MEAATDTNENPSDVADSDDDLPDLLPADVPPYHLTMPGNFRGRYRNVPQGNPTGIGLYLMLEQFIISYDVTYRLPARPSVSVPPVLVEQCAACLLAGRGFTHRGNIYRRTDRLRGEYLEWEPCHPPRLQRAKL